MKPERKTLPEQVAVSMNAKALRLGDPNVETALTKVAAFGAATLHIHHGSDRQRAPVFETVGNIGHVPDPRDVLAAQLASVLSHRRDALQGRISEAIDLFARWMAFNRRFDHLDDRSVLLPRLAMWALHEWLSGNCIRCGGSGRMEILRDGTPVRGRGLMQRNAIFRDCAGKLGCGGTGKAVPSPIARRKALGLTAERYDKENWDRIFRVALIWLARLKGRINRPLTAQLERSTKRD